MSMTATKTRRIGVIMNGVTGRMGANQHLARSIVAIREQGGIQLGEDETLLPDPILVGRNEEKLKALSAEHSIDKYSTDLDTVLADSDYPVYFDSLTTRLRVDNLRKAIAAGKHVYSEKPTATSTDEALALYNEAETAGVKHGVVHDMLWLPGLLQLKDLIDSGFFGEILSVRGEFGYWVFEGFDMRCQRPSWNYRKEDGGGIIVDMFCHWRYVIEHLFGDIGSFVTHAATHVKRRVDEDSTQYDCTAEDSAYALFLLKNGVPLQFNSSWCVRVRRDDLLTLQVDGSKGSAVAGLRKCYVQSAASTPRHVWNPDVGGPPNCNAQWHEVPPNEKYDNAFKIQWELFLRHVIGEGAFPWNLHEAAKGIQLAELALESWRERRWMDVPELS